MRTAWDAANLEDMSINVLCLPGGLGTADIRIHLRRYYEYLQRYGYARPAPCESGVQAEVVFGKHDEVGLTAAERRTRVVSDDAPALRARPATC